MQETEQLLLSVKNNRINLNFLTVVENKQILSQIDASVKITPFLIGDEIDGGFRLSLKGSDFRIGNHCRWYVQL